jgi:ribonucleoside-diphosphate reductase alpha chain
MINKTNNLTIDDYFTKGKSAYEGIEWETRKAEMPPDDDGTGAFVQEGVIFPKNWSQLATDIVSSKYFYGEIGKPEREYSLKQLIDRVTEKISELSIQQGYLTQENAKKFQEELKYISINQLSSFNSPVWFNVGVDSIIKDNKKGGIKGNFRYDLSKNEVVQLKEEESYYYPQTSACFIQSVDDTMEDIMRLATSEAMLFKYGSGTGSNLSTLRSSKEKLSGGGKPSGPKAYLKFYDDVAGIVKSGGKTRRAAKMDILNVEHPDIIEFIEAKAKEEDKMRALVDAGYSIKEAQETVAYQNTNLSVRVTNDFMEKVKSGGKYTTKAITTGKDIEELDAKQVFKLIAENAWKCGDPGIQFDTTINKWHTCPNSAKINASNPCSEYMFIDDSSCNLASLNLLRFLKEDGTFDINSFESTINNIILAQDIIIDGSSYPSKEIAENSHKFRPLGLGYANLGALIMSLGLPYDSDEARATAAAITSLMTAQAYITSSEIAKVKGTFSEYEKNKEPMLNVMKMHKEYTHKIDKNKIPKDLENILQEAEKSWNKVLLLGKKYGFRNAQATVLAPTGTISFMMDCDTTGIECDSMLVKYKKLSGGGKLRIVNNSVRPALKKLGYNPNQIRNICEYIDKNNTIENCDELKKEHLPIFDCALKAVKDEKIVGKRVISPQGHIDMMVAVQPFISGAISKTVNLPEEKTKEDIYNIYFNAWVNCLKSIALYRDNSKATQVLGTRKSERKFKWGERKRLPQKREGIEETVSIYSSEGETKVHLRVGEYPTGEPGEFFISFGKSGSPHAALYGEMGKDLSRRRQLGEPLEDIIQDGIGTTGDVGGRTNHPFIKTCTSIKDLFMKIVALEYLGDTTFCENKPNEKEIENLRYKTLEKRRKSVQEDYSTNDENSKKLDPSMEINCPNCGNRAKREGCLTICTKCGLQDQTGCSG